MELISKLKKVSRASRQLRLSTTEQRNQVLKNAAELLIAEQKNILKANAQDLKKLPANTPAAFRDRLTLDITRLGHMAVSLLQVADLPDPLNVETERRQLPNGLLLRKVRSPLGVVFMIFESRPNVAIEAFSIGFKAGNAMVLRGGKESQETTAALYHVLKTALKQADLNEDILLGITDPDRKIVNQLLKQKDLIDVVVPRGGDKLIEFVTENSLIPIIKNDRGMCHIYIHEDARPEMATQILVNAKTQRPGVCNSMETLLVHEKLAPTLLPEVYQAMSPFHVRWYAAPRAYKILKKFPMVNVATENSWKTEYLDFAINCKIVNSLDQAVDHIHEFGSRHSECIVTSNEITARKFQLEVDAAAVYWNASTRFTDGFEFGLGGELGISTQKLHVRGPVGLTALTSERWLIDGTGQTR